MGSQISKNELDFVKSALAHAERGEATLEELGRAHTIAVRAGGARTIGLVMGYIRGMTPGPRAGFFSNNVAAGLLSGFLIWMLFGRHGKVRFS